MQERMLGMLNKAVDSWKSLEKSQKIKLSVVAAVFVLALGITVYLAAKPRMTIILNNEDFAIVIQAENVLKAEGIKFNTINNSTGLEVPEKDAGRARTLINGSSITSTSRFSFYDLLNYSSLGTSDRVTKEMMTEQKQNSIAKDLEMYDNVKQASVTLSVPNDSVFFWEAQQYATASVILETSGTISEKMGELMARHVMRSVQGLEMDRIEISDTRGKTIYSGLLGADVSTSTLLSEIEQYTKKEIETVIKNIMGPQFNDVQTLMNLVFDRDQVSNRWEIYTSPLGEDSDTGLAISKSTDNSSVTNGSSAADPGTGTNNNNTPTYPNGSDNQSATSKSTIEQFVVNKEIREFISGSAGSLIHDKSSMAVFVYKNVAYDEKALRKSGVISRDKTWDEFKRENDVMKEIAIGDTMVTALKTGTGIEQLVVVGYEKPIFIEEITEPIELQQIIILVILAVLILLLAYALIRRSQPDEITEIEPELSVEDLLVSTQLEEESETERLRSLEIKESETKRQIEKFVGDKPEAVAQLLRNWINDEWE